MKGTKLTERQRLFATEHHNVLEEFLLTRGLDYDDYYDVVVFKFLKAVKQYDEIERLRKQAFKDVAVSLMQMAVDNHRRALKAERENVYVLSLDYMPKNRDGLLFSERIADETTDTNEMYIGNMVQGRTKRSLYNNMPQKLMDKDHWIVVENTHEAIISKEDFYKVQDMLAEYDRKPAVRKTHKKENIFKGKVICGECGHKMTRSGSSDSKEKNHFYCRHHAIYKDSCDVGSIREDILTNIVHQSIKVQILSLSKIEQSMQRSASSPETKHAMYSLTKQISETLSTVAYIKENRIRIAKDYAMQILNEEEYDILRKQFDMELAQAAEKLELLEKQRCKFNKLFTAERWISELRQYSSSKKLSASMLNEFVKCVKVYSDNRVEIEWKHKDTIAEYIELLNGGVELAG